ncbi:MAG: DNA-binding response regulator CiaR [uncultured Sulfurovum sp.]|uniref:DNA-binding response regulator CiaR n=1 Tax=uncultured Sulfurovum sp. TaxID=269237 RepID=A0A6S6SG23_9BACT|nr:MAG: DNA-binding response regulator CiaR [uncultured Sulfurovum sp.]
MKILLLEDDKTLHESLKAYLKMEKFEVLSAFCAADVYALTFENSFDLYLFDVSLLGESGFDVLKALREAGDKTPAIYITALIDISSMTKGFNAGADDYIKKPFDPEELVLRIKSRYLINNFLSYKNLSYAPMSKELRKDGELVLLSSLLSQLFHLFLVNKNSVVATHLLLEKLNSPNTNALRVNIAKLKNKLNLDIKNIKGVGYMLEEI